MEIGWYLRLSRSNRLEFWTKKEALAILEDQAATVSGWKLSVAEAGDHLVGVFTRA